MIDTHTHIYLQEFDTDRDLVIQRAKDAGITALLLPNIDLDSVEALHQCIQAYRSFCKPMMGLHPCSVTASYKDALEKLSTYLHLKSTAYCGIGEIGLDYYWDNTFVNEQKKALETQLNWCDHFSLPFSMHTREAIEDAIAITKTFLDKGVRGVFHCFGGSLAQAKQIIDMNCMLGIGGVVTYKKAALDEVLRYIPLSHIVLETDAPYLPPVPNRGKRNEPAYLTYIVKRIAGIYSVSESEVMQQTADNARRMFGE